MLTRPGVYINLSQCHYRFIVDGGYTRAVNLFKDNLLYILLDTSGEVKIVKLSV